MKKIVITSDLHYGFNDLTYERIIDMIYDIEKEKPDALILAGDIAEQGHSEDNFKKCLDMFSNINCLKALILGNHDLWNPYNYQPSIKLWEDILPTTTDKCGFKWLESNDLILGNTAIVGTIGWYDYSYAPTNLQLDNDFYFDHKRKYNNDGNFIDWDKNDIEFANECKDRLIVRIEKLEQNEDVKNIIVITHVPILRQQMVKSLNDNIIGNAYFGNFSTGDEVMKFSKVSHIVSGHTHRETYKEIIGIETYVIGSDYNKPRYICLEI